MATLTKIDSNITNLRAAEEVSIGVVDANAQWDPLEPNSYSDFGGELKLVARNPINSSRQRKKGTVVDLDASGGINHDLVPYLQKQLQGFFFASLRRKGEGTISSIDGATEKIELSHAMNMFVGSLVWVTGNAISTNNGLKRITAVNSVFAVGTYTQTSNALTAHTVTIGTQTYSFKAALTAPTTANEVLIGATASDSIDNLIAAINGAAGSGTLYGSLTVPHTLVTAAAGVGDTMTVTAKLDGPSGNSIVTTTVGANHSFGAGTLLTGDADITVFEDLTTETPPAGATVVVVGFQFGAADATIDASGPLPKLTATVKDLTQLGLIPGEFFFIGGDAAIMQFATAADNGFARARTIATTNIILDKTQNTMVTDLGAGKTIQVFLGRALKNELGTLIVRRTHQLERTLGAPNTDFPSQVQAEYLKGQVPNQVVFNIPKADKLNIDMSWVGTDRELRSSTTGLKAGTRPSLVEQDAFNTSSDITRIKLSTISQANAAPSPLFAFAEDIKVTINNNVTPNKAVGVLGAFEATAGTFEVGVDLTAYFADVASIQAVQDNADATIDMQFVKANGGISLDLPMLALGDGRADVVQNEAIKLNLASEAATGAKIDTALDYTAMLVFYDYLPSLAG